MILFTGSVFLIAKKKTILWNLTNFSFQNREMMNIHVMHETALKGLFPKTFGFLRQFFFKRGILFENKPISSNMGNVYNFSTN